MGVEPARCRRAEGRSAASTARARRFERNGFERNGVDRIPERERTSTPGTFFVIFVGGSVGLGAVAFGWVGHYVRAGPVGHDLRDRRGHRGRADPAGAADPASGRAPRRTTPPPPGPRSACAAGSSAAASGSLTCLSRSPSRCGPAAPPGWRSPAGCSGCPTPRAPRAWPTRWSRPSRWRWRSGGTAGWCAATAIISVLGGGLLMVLMPVAFAGAIKLGLRRQRAAAGDVLGDVAAGRGDDRGRRARWSCARSSVTGPATSPPSGTRPAQPGPVASLGMFLGFVVPGGDRRARRHRVHRPAAPFTVSLATESPLWYAVLLLPFAVLGGVGLVAQSLYSAGLDLEALVVRLTRARATVIIGVIGVVLVYLGLLAPTVQGAIAAALLVLAELSAPVGGDRRDRVPAGPRPLRRRRPAGVQPPPDRRPVLVLRRLELAGRAGLGRRVDRRPADDPDPAVQRPARGHRGRRRHQPARRVARWPR